jgi:hypothetical protein
MVDSFPKGLVRLEDLFLRNRQRGCRNFFNAFPSRLRGSEATLAHYADIEDCLNYVPSNSWEEFVKKVNDAACQIDVKRNRNWEKLHDVFNEARGARVLRNYYQCYEIEMLPTKSGVKTPDWRGKTAAGAVHYAEVKTLNHSDEEQTMWAGGPQQPLRPYMSDEFLSKFRKVYLEACHQLAAVSDADSAVKVVVLAVHVDYNVVSLNTCLTDMVKRAASGVECARFPIHAEVLSGYSVKWSPKVET